MYRCEIKTLSRSQEGGGPTAKDAYRRGAKEQDLAGQTHDYSRKGDLTVSGSEMLLPPDAPIWAENSGEFWRRVDATEKRKDARYGREVLLTLPKELSDQQRQAAVREFSQKNLLSRGMVGTVSYHSHGEAVGPVKNPGEYLTILAEVDRGLPLFTRVQVRQMKKAGDQRLQHDHVVQEKGAALRRFQPHAHIMVADRRLDPGEPSGFAKTKDRSWNDKQVVLDLREGWETTINRHLEMAGSNLRLDRRRRADRGLDGPPEPKLGHAPSEMRRQEWQEAREARRLERQRRQLDRAILELTPGYASGPDGSPKKWAPKWALDAAFLDMADQVKWARLDQENKRLVIGLKSGGQVTDDGKMLTAIGDGAMSRDQAAAMARVATAKGWPSVVLSGAEQAQVLMAEEYARQGVALHSASPAAHAAWEAQRAHQRKEQDLERMMMREPAKQTAVTPPPPPVTKKSDDAFASLEQMMMRNRPKRVRDILEIKKNKEKTDNGFDITEPSPFNIKR